MGYTESEITQEIIDEILSGGRRTTATRVRSVLDKMNVSYLNKKDGGVLEELISYDSEFVISDPKQLVHAGYVTAAIEDVGDGFFALEPTADVTVDLVATYGVTFDNATFFTFNGTAQGDFIVDAFDNATFTGSGGGVFAIDNYFVKIGETIVDASDLTSIDTNDRRLYATNASYTVDWEVLRLYSAGAPSFDWGTRIVFDGSTQPSADFQNRAIYNASGGQVGNWDATVLYRPTGPTISVHWTNSQLWDVSGAIVSVDWDQRFLYTSAGNKVANWNASRLYDLSEIESISWDIRNLNASTGLAILDYSSATEGVRYTADFSGAYTARSLVDFAYVNTVAQGLHIHALCAATTTGTLTSIISDTVVYNNGASGVGATLTLSTPLTALDGYTLVVGNRIVVKDETAQEHNGIYIYTSSTVLTRSTDFNEPLEIQGGDFVFIQNGTVYGGSGLVQTEDITTIGTDAIIFQQFSAGTAYTNGSGITLTGTVFSIDSNAITDAMIGTHTSTKISITNKALLNSSIVYTDQTNDFGNFVQGFYTSRLKVWNGAHTFGYLFLGDAIVADRAVSLPLLAANDVFVFEAHVQSLTNKTINATNNSITDTGQAQGDILRSNGTKFVKGNPYTEAFSALTNPGVASTWTVTTVPGAPVNAVVDIRMTASTARDMGVRIVGSSLSRVVSSNSDAQLMRVKTDAYGQIEVFADSIGGTFSFTYEGGQF